MAAILNWILDSDILLYSLRSLKNTPFSDSAQKNLHSFILTQLDDSSHLEFCQLEFDHLGFNHLSFPSQTHSHLPRLVPNICTKKLHSFILTQLDDGSHLEFYHLGFSHLSFSSQTHWHLPRLVPTICTKKTSLIHSDSTWWWQPSWILPSWIGFRHLVIFSQIHSKTLSLHSDYDSN